MFEKQKQRQDAYTMPLATEIDKPQCYETKWQKQY